MSDKRTVRSKLSAAVVLTLFLMSCGQSPDVAQVPAPVAIQAPGAEEQINEDLFSDASEEEAQSVDSAQVFDPSEAAKKRRLVKVNFAPLVRQGAKMTDGQKKKVFIRLPLNVFNDEKLDLILDQVERVSSDNLIFTGQISGDLDSAVTIVVNKDNMAANIRYGDRTESYEVRYAANGLHVVNLREDEQEGPCPAVQAPEDISRGNNVAEDEATAVDGTDSAMATNTISMLVAYTPNARIKYGSAGIISLIQLGIADTNRAMADSGINAQVILAGTMEVERNETGSFSTDLGYLRSKTDSRWNGVHTKRSALHADQVTLVATYPNNTGTNGIGYINASFSNAFTVVKSSSFNVYTFSHELGHNLGLNHSDGYVNSSGRFRTIIAYGSYPRIRRYSNPSLTYNGYATGNSYHNEAKIINSHTYTLANFY